MSTELILIRHGTTAWNKQKRYCGRIDVGLSREGMGQAKKLNRMLKGAVVDKIYCSDRKRALQTCRIVFDGARFTRVRALREINFGVLEGLHHKQIIKKYSPLYENWIEDPYRHHIPRAEKMVDFKKRVCSAINKIARDNPAKTIAVVCHGGVIGAFVSSLRRSKNFWHYVPKATSVTVVKYKNRKPRVLKFNDIAHLGI